MITERDTIKCEAIFNDDKTHRLSWKRVWNKDKPLACVIMLNPCHANTVLTDTTTALVVNNIARLDDYGGVIILNLFSFLTTKLNFRSEVNLNDYSNDTYIRKAAEEASVVILAWGKSGDTNAKIYHRSQQVVKLLQGQKEKLRVITDGIRMGLHPLCPSLRSQWLLTSVDEWIKESEEIARKREEREAERRAAQNAPEAIKEASEA